MDFHTNLMDFILVHNSSENKIMFDKLLANERLIFK